MDLKWDLFLFLLLENREETRGRKTMGDEFREKKRNNEKEKGKEKEKKTHDGVGLDEDVTKVRLRHYDLQQLMPQAGSPDGERASGVVGLDGPVVELGGGRDVGVVEVEVLSFFF